MISPSGLSLNLPLEKVLTCTFILIYFIIVNREDPVYNVLHSYVLFIDCNSNNSLQQQLRVLCHKIANSQDSCPRLRKSYPSAFFLGATAPALTITVPSGWTQYSLLMAFLNWEAQNWTQHLDVVLWEMSTGR